MINANYFRFIGLVLLAFAVAGNPAPKLNFKRNDIVAVVEVEAREGERRKFFFIWHLSSFIPICML